jgi:protein gp37
MARRLAAMAEADIHKGRKPGRKRKYIGTAERRGHVDVFTGKIGYDDAITEPLMWTKPSKVFVNSESDLFHEAVPFEFIYRVLAVIGASPKHTFQVLTKRAERMAEFFSDTTRVAYGIAEAAKELLGVDNVGRTAGEIMSRWPMRNLWLGVSVEDQQRADERIPSLLKTPAAIRFLSCEPLLGPVDLRNIVFQRRDPHHAGAGLNDWTELYGDALTGFRATSMIGGIEGQPHLDWVIAGGESGAGARPSHPAWFRSLRDQCQAAGVPFLFKQWGEWLPFHDAGELEGVSDRTPVCLVKADGRAFSPYSYAAHAPGQQMARVGKKNSGRLLDGREWNAFPEVSA